MNISPLICPLSEDSTEATNQICDIFLNATRRSLSKSGEWDFSQKSTLEAGASSWRPELGVLYLHRKKFACEWDPPFVNAQFEIVLFLSGAIKEIQIDCVFRKPLTFAGVQIGPGHVSIVGQDAKAEARDSQGGSYFEFECIDLDHRIWAAKDAVILGPNEMHSFLCVNGSRWYEYWIDDTLQDPSVKPFDSPILEFTEAMERTLEFILEYVPEYKGWVENLLKEVSPLPLVRDGSESGSFRFFPGHIKISTPDNVGLGVSNLVHECSHQHLHLLEWTGSTVQKDVEEYSVLKGTVRPLSKILLGFHALANALIAMTIAADRGASDRKFLHVRDHLREQTKSLRDSVFSAGTQNLSVMGLAIFESLDNTVSDLL